MTAETIHTCSYYCERPECVRRQRDELRDRLESGRNRMESVGDRVESALASAPPSAPEPEVHSYDPTEHRESVTIRWPDGKCLGYVLDRTRYTDNLPPSAPVGVDAVMVPKEPSEGVLVSMAIRYDHGLGVPGYYDQPLFGGENGGHKRRMESTVAKMRQLYEEVVGAGFYSREREEEYAALAQQPAAAMGEEIMVNAAHGVYTLPLQPSWLLSGPRFVVYVPAPEQQPAAPSGAVNVVGMPEFDGLMDHIHEYGTTADGVVERANAFARAVLARYAPQQPAAAQTQEMSMTTETSNALGEWPARYACNGPEGTFWTDDATLANKLIAATFDRDEWTVTDTQNPTAAAQQQGGAE